MNKTILIIEDDPVALGSVGRGLQDAGFEVVEADNGTTGLEIALATHPDLIFSDNILPGLKGTEILEKLRADSWGATVPFILITGQFDMDAVNDSLKAGNTDFLVKDDTGLHSIIETIQRRLAG